MAKSLCEICGKELKQVREEVVNGHYFWGVCTPPCNYKRNISEEINSNEKKTEYAKSNFDVFKNTRTRKPEGEYLKSYTLLELQRIIMKTDDKDIAIQVIKEAVDSGELTDTDGNMKTFLLTN